MGGEKREEKREVRDRGNEMRKKGKVSKQNSCNFFKERRIQTRETGVDAFSKGRSEIIMILDFENLKGGSIFD